jgi:hypothetical protein
LIKEENEMTWIEKQIGEFVIRKKWWILLIAIIIVLLTASGTQFLTFNNDTRVFFSVKNPQLQALEELENTYNKISSVFFASVSGFEYSFAELAGTRLNVDLICQWVYDSRVSNATSPYEDDVMLGLRLGFNDLADSQLLAGLIQDLNNLTRIISVEASRRIGLSWRESIEAWLFLSTPVYDQFYSFRNDDFFLAELVYYF